MARALSRIKADLSACRICETRFAETATAHAPRPIVWFNTAPRILIAGQAPGMRVHQSGVPFDDPSGDRLRDWMGIDRATFYNQDRIAIVPMGFCFPGYNATAADLPPPAICAKTWRTKVLDTIGQPRLMLLVGGLAQKHHLRVKTGVTQTVADWRAHISTGLPLPHPSWRNTGWINKNPWFTAEVLPELKRRVKEALND